MITEPLTDPDHLEIRDMVVDFAQATFTSERVRAAALTPLGYDEVAWKQMVDLGWTGLSVDGEAGGEDLGCVVQCLVHRELAGRLAPGPYLATAGFAVAALTALASRELALPRLRSIAGGAVQYAVAVGGSWSSPRAGVRAVRAEGGWLLSGQVPLLLDGARATQLLVVGTTDDGARLLFEAGAGEAGRVPTVDATRAFGDVCLDATPAVALSGAPVTAAAVAGVVDRMAVLLAAEMVGAASAALRRTLDYLGIRHQFGRPIGSFQALKHRCADMAVSVTVAQELVFSAAALVDAGHAAALELAAPLALARAGEVLRHVTEEAIQLHGGVGFTDEVDIGLYYKRALVDLELLAAPADAYARVDAVRGRTGIST